MTGAPDSPAGIPSNVGGTGELSRRVAAGAGWAQISRLAEVFSSLVLSLLLIRALGPVSYGSYSFLVNAAAMGAVILSLGFAETLMRFVSALIGEGSIAQVRTLVRGLVAVRAISYALAIVVLFALHGIAARVFHLPLIDRYWVAIALLMVSQGAIEFTTSFAYARLRSRDVAIARTVGQVVALLFFAVIVVARLQDPVTAAITVSLSYLGAAILLVFRGLGGMLASGPAAAIQVRPFVGFALVAWAVNLATVGLAGQIDVILLGALRHDIVQIAYYSVATLIFVKFGVLLSGWAGTAISNFAELQVRRAEAAGRLFNLYMRVNLLIALFVYPPLVLLAQPITRYVFGPAYLPAAQLLSVYGLFWIVSSSLAAGIPLSVLMAVGAQRQALWIRSVTGVLNVVLDVVLIPSLGALGAIIATGTANALAHVADFAIAASRVHAGYPWALLLKVGIASVLAAAIPLLLRPTGLLSAGLGLIAYGLVFVGVLLVTRPLEAGDVELAGRLNPRLAQLAARLSPSPRRPSA